MRLSFIVCFTTALVAIQRSAVAESNSAEVPPDIVVAADGSGDFKTIQAALDSIPRSNRERKIIFVKNGVYKEKIRVDADCITVRGESRDGVRLEYSQLNDDFSAHPDEIGRAVINVWGDDFVLQNLTAENTARVVNLHAFTLYGEGDRTVVTDCNLLSVGADTLSCWKPGGGDSYYARCTLRGATDFVCPRGWCYMTDCSLDQTKKSASVWHDGSKDQDQKFVIRNCTFTGIPGHHLARHHHDAAFYFLGCRFPKSMIDHAPLRVVYPIGDKQTTDEDIAKNRELDETNRWGERAWFHNCHRDGGDYPWHADNLKSAPGSPSSAQITPLWTFAGRWDPENTSGPKIRRIASTGGQIVVQFDEPVTVKGSPQLKLSSGRTAPYVGGSGTDRISFAADKLSDGEKTVGFDPAGGTIIASIASAAPRFAVLDLPK